MIDSITRLLVTSLVLAALCPACVQLDAAGEGETSFQFSTSATEEILSLGWHGGLGRFAPRYRLYGDGRLVREIVDKGGQRALKRSDEVQLSLQDIDLLMRLCVDSELAELTPQRLRRGIGQEPLRADDGGTALLRLRFISYQRAGEEEQAPFSPQIEMHAPKLQLRFFSEVREIQAMVALDEALDGYFSQSATEVLYGRKRDNSE
jgi:hypothetical protein